MHEGRQGWFVGGTAPVFFCCCFWRAIMRNQVGHGLGLRSMERIVHACGGELAVERTESRFTAVVRLPRIPVSYI